MNVVDLLNQEFPRKDILCLNVLPDAMLMATITALCVKECNQGFLFVFTKLVQDCMGGKRSEIIEQLSNFPVYRFRNKVKMRGHYNKGKELHSPLCS